MSDITIDNTWLQKIKIIQGFPEIENILLSDNQMKDYIIERGMHDFFVKFPLKYPVEYSLVNELELSFPDIYTFGVYDVRVLGKGYAGSPGGSFWDIVMWNQVGFHSNFRNMYGSKIKGYNPNELRQLRFLDMQTNNSLINQGTFKYRVDQILRKLYVYSTISAKMNVTWAKYSNDFSSIPYQFQYDVVDRCKAYLLLHLADSAGMIDDTVLEAKIDVAALKERANTLLTAIDDKWKDYPDPIAMIQ